MEGNHFQGDLADVVRASSGCGVVRDVDSNARKMMSSFQLQLPLNTDGCDEQCFGDPFSSMRDPLEGIGDGFSPSRSAFLDSSFHDDFLGDETTSVVLIPPAFQISTTSSHNSISDHHGPSMGMSSCDFQGVPAGVCVDRLMSPISPKAEAEASSFIHTAGRVQISSPPQNPIIKRRKSQAKKVVCIAAPTAANSRQGGGEVVPSDLWAWRKYGQKPIKGSPYPRGYYRCSSSKGCSARKQVERSRTDPNMLVITYTSEHNHPWPTQRNALAGSSRISAATHSNASPAAALQSNKKTNVKEEVEGPLNHVSNNGPSRVEAEKGVVTNQLMMNDLVIDYDKSYRPVIMQEEDCVLGGGDHDLFADLRELEVDDLLHSRGGGNKSMLNADPFGCLFDWPTSNSTTTNNDNDNTNLHQNS